VSEHTERLALAAASLFAACMAEAQRPGELSKGIVEISASHFATALDAVIKRDIVEPLYRRLA
jgi:hypothetical protein